MADHPLRPANHHSLGEPLPHQRANGPQAHLEAIACKQRPSLAAASEEAVVSSGISQPFGWLFPTSRQVTYVLLTRAPLYSGNRSPPFSHDLHVLGTPPAFVLSQDQTLQFIVDNTRRCCPHLDELNKSPPLVFRTRRPFCPAGRPDPSLPSFQRPDAPGQSQRVIGKPPAGVKAFAPGFEQFPRLATARQPFGPSPLLARGLKPRSGPEAPAACRPGEALPLDRQEIRA